MEEAKVPHTDVPLSQIHGSNTGTTYEAIHSEHNPVHRDDDSVRTASVHDSTARNSEKYHDTGFSDVRGGVNVQRAEAEFAELSKELSRASNHERRLSRIQSRQSRKEHTPADVEKGGVDGSETSDEAFDLEHTLRGSRDEEEAAGIKSKRIGVVWDDLTVSGIGEEYIYHV